MRGITASRAKVARSLGLSWSPHLDACGSHKLVCHSGSAGQSDLRGARSCRGPMSFSRLYTVPPDGNESHTQRNKTQGNALNKQTIGGSCTRRHPFELLPATSPSQPSATRAPPSSLPHERPAFTAAEPAPPSPRSGPQAIGGAELAPAPAAPAPAPVPPGAASLVLPHSPPPPS